MSNFEALTPFMEKWAKPTEYERSDARRSSTPQELKAFYDATVPHLPNILNKVDEYPVGQIPDAVKPLFYIALSLAEITPNVEFYNNSPGIPFAFDESRLIGDHCAIAD
jgi:hypothetical protein